MDDARVQDGKWGDGHFEVFGIRVPLQIEHRAMTWALEVTLACRKAQETPHVGADPRHGPRRISLADDEGRNRSSVHWRRDAVGQVGEIRHWIPARRRKDR